MILYNPKKLVVVFVLVLLIFTTSSTGKKGKTSKGKSNSRPRREAEVAAKDKISGNGTGIHGDGKCDDFDSPTRTDPFPTSIKWAQFVRQMDELVKVVKNATLSFTTVLSSSNPVKYGNYI